MDIPELGWEYKQFGDLSPDELYKILNLRSEVFVVEQNCVYLDTDNKDQQSFHLCGWLDHELIAYARILPPGTSYIQASIGRLATALKYRKEGAGRILMQKAIDHTLGQFHVNEIKIGAQLYLNNFYSSFGFIQCSDEYLEDGIPHIEMLLSK